MTRGTMTRGTMGIVEFWSCGILSGTNHSQPEVVMLLPPQSHRPLDLPSYHCFNGKLFMAASLPPLSLFQALLG